jgi:hypothetical protein
MSIASEISRLQGVKSDILGAIANKGVTVPAGSALDDCPALISSISGEGGYYDVIITDKVPDNALGNDGDLLVYITQMAYEDGGTIIPIQTDNTNCSASSILSSYQPYYAFDQDNSTFWSGDTNLLGWVQYDFGNNPQVITNFSLLPRVYSSARQLAEYKVEASNDGINYITLYHGKIPKGNTLSWFYIEFENSTAYRFYRVNGMSTNGATVTLFEVHFNTVNLANPNWVTYITRYKKMNGIWTPYSNDTIPYLTY